MSRIIYSAVILGVLFCSSVVFATPNMAKNASDKFTAMDKNEDGKVSLEEFTAAYPNMQKAAFEAIDSNADGFIVLDEWLEFSSGHARDMGESASMGHGSKAEGNAEKTKRALPLLEVPAQ